MLRRLARWAMIMTGFAGSLLLVSGEWRSPWLWSLIVATSLLFLWVALRVLDSDLARERFRPPTRGADATALAWIRAAAATLWIFAPLDSGRLHWSAPVPAPVRVLGICGFLFGAWFTFRAMAANRFFSPVVRVQSERGHRVVDQGPYARLRHPGYLGMALFAPMAALALGSWWALMPAGLYATLILRRAAVEDRFLRDHLPGYNEYAARVRFRLLPGIW